MMKILVTGASGFIGNYVVKYLLDSGYNVIASSTNLDKAQKRSWFEHVTYVPFDLASFERSQNYYDFFCRPDSMIHLSWEGLPNFKDDFHVEINLPRHKALLENMVKYGLRDLTVSGTCFEYGMQEGMLDEDAPALATVPYAVAKNALREFLWKLKSVYPVMVKWVRLFYMYGEGQHPKSLLSQLERAITNGDPSFNMSGGEQERDYLPVQKVAEYIVKIAVQQKVTGIINCCSGIPISVKALVEEYLKRKNRTIQLNLGHYPYPDYEPMRFWGNNNKLKRVLSYD